MVVLQHTLSACVCASSRFDRGFQIPFCRGCASSRLSLATRLGDERRSILLSLLHLSLLKDTAISEQPGSRFQGSNPVQQAFVNLFRAVRRQSRHFCVWLSQLGRVDPCAVDKEAVAISGRSTTSPLTRLKPIQKTDHLQSSCGKQMRQVDFPSGLT